MSGTLHLIDRLLVIARNLQHARRDTEALHYLKRLAGFCELPPHIAEEVQVLLAEVQLRRRRFRAARRHLTVALLYRADSPHYHYLMAKALGAGRDANPARAVEHLRQAIELDGEQPRWLARLGALWVRQGEVEDGLGTLMRAVQLAPNDPAIVGQLVKELCRVQRTSEAQAVLLSARFRNPRDRRFEQLWNDFQFRKLHARQRAARRDAETSWRTADGRPLVLPLGRRPAELPENVRQDAAERLPGPHRRQPLRRPGRMHG